MEHPVESAEIREGSPEEESGPDGGRRPMPVRQAMEVEDGEGEDREASRVVRVPGGGEEWRVTVVGRSSSGIPPTRSIPLMDLSFIPVAEPDSTPLTVLCRGESLAELSDTDLLAHLASLLKPRRGRRTG